MWSNSASDLKSKHTRAQSARLPSASRRRPISGKTVNLFVNTDTIENVYTQSPQKMSNNPSKILMAKGISSEQLSKFRKTSVFRPSKTQEQLYQQNLQLKREINNLKNTMAINKGREVSSKKLIVKKQQLDREFQKQMYWTDTNKSHLISGIKYQYEKLKNEHAAKIKEVKEMKTLLMSSEIPETRAYIQQLQFENKRLNERIFQILSYQEGQKDQTNKEKKNPFAIAMAENQIKNQREKLQELDIRLRAANEGLNEKEKKIMFLQKLIVQKDNRQYHTHNKARKMEKNHHEITIQIKQLKEKNKKSEEEWEQIFRVQEEESRVAMENQKNINEKEVESRDKKILALELNVKNLQSMINKLKLSQSVLGRSQTSQERKKSFQEDNLMISNRTLQAQTQIIVNQTEQQQKTQQKQVKKRVPQRADKRHSEQSKKLRKVRLDEVRENGQLMKFRLIQGNIDENQLKQFFVKKKERKNSSGSLTGQKQGMKTEQQIWQEQYISMKEVIEILREFPFRLREEESYQVARYAIEDCEEDFVYCDEGNQNKRDIVKSIIKAVVGDYEVNGEELEEEERIFMQRYKTNLQSALNTYYPRGKMTKKQLEDVLRTMGAELSEKMLFKIVGKMAENSVSLEELEYKFLFI